MPRYKFSWLAFDDKFLLALSEYFGFEPQNHHVSKEEISQYMTGIIKRPNLEFVRETRWIFHEYFLHD